MSRNNYERWALALAAILIPRTAAWSGEPFPRLPGTGLILEAARKSGPDTPNVPKPQDVTEKVIRGLVEVLEKDPRPHVRIGAAEELSHFGARAEIAIPALIQALKDDQYVGAAAAATLGGLGPKAKDAVGELRHLLATATEKYARKRAAAALGDIGVASQEVVTELIRVKIGDASFDVRVTAEEALRKLGFTDTHKPE